MSTSCTDEEFAKGLENIKAEIIEALRGTFPIKEECVTWMPCWQLGQPIPEDIEARIVVDGSPPLNVSFSKAQVSESSEGLKQPMKDKVGGARVTFSRLRNAWK